MDSCENFHLAPLGEEKVRAAKHQLCWAHGPNRAQVNVCGKGTCFHGHRETLCYATVVTVLSSLPARMLPVLNIIG